jgi:tRNA-specific 2-thiouridylase
MSGGVDSSVAAALLVEAGHEVVGVTMKTFCYQETPGSSRSCCGLEGISDARRVADRLGIAHYVFDVEEEFGRDVIDDFVREYARGRTPNPCVRCNANTKFRDLLRRGRALGCDLIATGHYARVGEGPHGAPALFRSADRLKDQTYFLWGLPPELVPLLRFPLGGMTKDEVRARARELGLATADKPESQEICFVPAGNYREFVRGRLPVGHAAFAAGRLVTEAGEAVGHHDGYAGFTVGQRKGLGGGLPEPRFVLEIRPDRREVVVGPRSSLLAPAMRVDESSWLDGRAPPVNGRVRVQIRHRAPAVSCTIARLAPDGTAFDVRFDAAQNAVTPGQSAAVFDEDRLLGGGRIAARLAD